MCEICPVIFSRHCTLSSYLERPIGLHRWFHSIITGVIDESLIGVLHHPPNHHLYKTQFHISLNPLAPIWLFENSLPVLMWYVNVQTVEVVYSWKLSFYEVVTLDNSINGFIPLSSMATTITTIITIYFTQHFIIKDDPAITFCINLTFNIIIIIMKRKMISYLSILSSV